MAKYSAVVYSELAGRRLCKVVFECRDPLLVNQYAKSRAGQKGIRNVQFTVVRDIKRLSE